MEWLETTWYTEIFFLLCSTVCAVLIVTFLAVHNNTPIASWHFYFSINTVVSTLGVLFKSTLLMAVSAALAQGKWTWFRKRTGSLSTFEAIDAGSRDTLESFRLLWRMRGHDVDQTSLGEPSHAPDIILLIWERRLTYLRHLVSAGALVIALGFMIEPFLQAIISDYERLVDMDASTLNNSRAAIGKSSRFDGGTQCVSKYQSRYPKVETTPDFAISASFFDGLNTAATHGYQNVSFTCMSGNCTWGEYASIAIRSTCFDISSHLKRTNLEESTDTTTSTSRKTSQATRSTETVESADVSPAFTDTEAPMYSAVPISAFSDVSTLNSMVAPIRSTVTRATIEVRKRATSSTRSPAASQTQSSAKWPDWTLEHLNLTLSNTATKWREANTFSVLQAAVVADPNLTLNFKDSQTLLAAFTTIRADDSYVLGSADWDAAPASAMECGLELSLNVYNSSVVNNVLVERILASASKKVPGSWLPLANFNQDDLHPDGLEVDPGTLESNSIYHHTFLYRDDYALDPDALQRNISGQFKITQKTIQSTVDFLTSLIRPDNDNATVKAVTQGDHPALYIYGSPILQPLFSQTDLNTTFDAVARGMSNAVRNLGAEPTLGTTQHLVRYYQVRWAFLALPLSLITIGTIFFILSIIDAHRAKVPNWKANSIATMVHGPDELLQRELRTKSHAHSLAIASETLAKLEWFPDGYALTAGQQSAAKISRPMTPVRDEEEHEMGAMRPPTSPQTPGSNVTLVEPQSGVGAERGGSRPVSPIIPRPAWSSNQLQGVMSSFR
ncbi:hypothetical protein D6D29_10048 [Aureobasidium pullulans]|nr:hypothetical protein D6D29_10048 [Aureobasidium pullulans]